MSQPKNPEEALRILMKGNARFVAGKPIHPHTDAKTMIEISKKQTPFATILGCSDSRVPAELVFDAGFGDLFVCRVAGNVASAEEIASCEYSLQELDVKLIMVMGHTRCGAVSAALSNTSSPGYISLLLDHIAVPMERVLCTRKSKSDIVQNVVVANVLYQIERIKRSPVVAEALARKQCKIVGAFYDMDTHEVIILQK